MINKRNFFKTLSSAALGALIVGNFSTVWMMEKAKPSNEQEQKKVIADFVKKIKSGFLKKTELKKIDEEYEEYEEDKTGIKEFCNSSFSEIFATKAMKLTNYTMDKELEDLVSYYAINKAMDIYYIKRSYVLPSEDIEKLAEYYVHISQIAKKVQELIKNLSLNKNFNVPEITLKVCDAALSFSGGPSHLFLPKNLFQKEDVVAKYIAKRIADCKVILYNNEKAFIELVSIQIKYSLLPTLKPANP